MNTTEYSIHLRELSDDYANHRILPDDYRARRKEILDEINSTINGINRLDEKKSDVEKANVNRVFSKALGMLKNNDGKEDDIK